MLSEGPRGTRHKLHDCVKQHIHGSHKRDATQQFRRRCPAAGERASILAGQRLVPNLTRPQRLTVAATPLGAVEHKVYDDKSKTGKDAR